MKFIKQTVLLLSVLLLYYSGCDKGLTIDPTGFSGTVRLKNFPSPDSLYELRIVAFKTFPSDSVGLLLDLIKGNVYVYPPIGTPGLQKFDSLGRNIDHYNYTLLLQGSVAENTSLTYIAMAWRYSPNFFSDWRPAGIYTLQPGTFNASTVNIPKHTFITNINFECDFRNLPPKPWR
jgi:hypothetical protein